MVPMGQGFASMSGPTKELEKLILSKKIVHGGNPILRWMFNNISMRTDPAGNIKIDKGKSSEKVDGLVAMVMALDRAIRNESGKSIYETQGITWIEPEESKPEETESDSESPKEETKSKSNGQVCRRCGRELTNNEYCTGCGAMVHIQPSPFEEIRIG